MAKYIEKTEIVWSGDKGIAQSTTTIQEDKKSNLTEKIVVGAVRTTVGVAVGALIGVPLSIG